jgi:mono/diheme cytochrome c family protein
MTRLRAATGLLFLAALLSLSFITPARAERSAAEGDVGRGQYVRYCASCHGMDAQGKGPVAGELKKPPMDLTRIAARRDGKFPDAAIAQFIDGRTVVPAHGTREMPVWGKRFSEQYGSDSTAEEVTRGKIGVLIEYLKSIQRK